MASLMLVNPRRKGRKKARKVARKNPRRKLAVFGRKSVRRARKNPRFARRGGGGGKGSLALMPTLMNGGLAGLGAIGAEAITGLLPLPAALSDAKFKPVVGAAVALGAGWVISKYVSKRFGSAIAEGGVAIAAYNAIRPMLAGKLPGLSAYDDMGMYDDLSGIDDGLLGVEDGLLGADEGDLGWLNPGTVANEM